MENFLITKFRKKNFYFKLALGLILSLLIIIALLPSLIAVPYNGQARDLQAVHKEWFKLESTVDAWMEKNRFSGIFMAAMDGEVGILRSFGLADSAKNIPFSEATKFNIGSLAKQFTGYILVELEREGKLNLDHKVSDYISELEGTEVGSLRLLYLSQHSSGLPVLPHLTKYLQVQMSSKVWTTKDFIEEVRTYQTDFEPGTKYQYSNVAYRLLGAIIERVEKKPFEDVLQARILTPFEMTDTYLERSDEVPDGLAKPYGPIKRFWSFGEAVNLPLPNWNYSMLTGAGGMVSSIRDFFKWDRALAKIKKKNPGFTNQYFIGGGPADYSYGWDTKRANKETGLPYYHMHTGGTPGFSSLIIRVPELDAAIVLLVNSFWSEVPGESHFYRELVKELALVKKTKTNYRM